MLMMRSLIILAVVAGVAIEVPKYLPKDGADGEPLATQPKVDKAALAPANTGYTLKADDSGHFRSRFRLNGKAIEAMIDTGATYVAMNEETARSIGVGGDRLRFRYEVETANGRAQAARVTLSSIEIGSIRVRNVDALVLRDTSLNSVLIGMSFMKKLTSWKVEAGQMQLVN